MVGGERAQGETTWAHLDQQLRQRGRKRVPRIQVLHKRLIRYRGFHLFKPGSFHRARAKLEGKGAETARLALLNTMRESDREMTSVHQGFDLSAEDVVIVFGCPAACQLYVPTRAWTFMHHLPISEKLSRAGLRCYHASRRGRGRLGLRSVELLISLVMFVPV